tara:strand:+ start:1814 stop:2200 length:387 start_codon:yes stop_codon:yes gene_type:complete
MMARKCSICRKAGHNARNCPNKDAPATKANAKDKPTTTKGKYPDYFYDNAPIWVESLEKVGLKTTPTGTGINAKFCGNCKNLVAGRGIATGEPYCKLNEAAVRAQWVCRKWAKGTVADIKEPKLGIDV